MLTISPAGIKNVQAFEGFSSETYTDSAGVNTIGFGHTSAEYAFPGNKITKAKATELLKQDLEEAEQIVRKYVKVELSQPAFDALVSLVFNIGLGNFKSSTLLKRLNAGDYVGAADEFPKWRKAAGKVLPGLVKRRAAERAMFLSGIKEEEHLESNIEPDAPQKPSVTSSKPIMGLAATGVAGTLQEASQSLAPLAEYSDYLKYLFVILVIASIALLIYHRKEE